MSQIATTIEQSRRLLEAGLKRESCDMEWVNVDAWDREQKRFVGKWVISANPCGFDDSKYVPAWSFSKLWEIRHEMAKSHAVISMDSRVSVEDAFEVLVGFFCSILLGFGSAGIDGGPRIPAEYLALPL